MVARGETALGGGSLWGRGAEVDAEQGMGSGYRPETKGGVYRLPSASAGRGKPLENLGRRSFRILERELRTLTWVFDVSPAPALLVFIRRDSLSVFPELGGIWTLFFSRVHCV